MPLLSEQAINDLKVVQELCENLHEKIILRLRKQYALKKNDPENFTEKYDQGPSAKEQKIGAKSIEKIKRKISAAFKYVGRFLGRTN